MACFNNGAKSAIISTLIAYKFESEIGHAYMRHWTATRNNVDLVSTNFNDILI